MKYKIHKKVWFYFVLIILTPAFQLFASGKTPPVFNHFTYPQGKYKALIMSFDDGVDSDIKLIELFNKYHIVGTFNLSSKLIGTSQDWPLKNGKTMHQNYIAKDQIATLYRKHEIAVHGATHQNFKKINKQQILEEINSDLQNLRLFTKKQITSLAYPFGVTNDSIAKIVASTGISNARTVKGSGNFDLPANLLMWNPTCRDNETLNYLDQYLKLKEDKLSVFYVWGHSWELGSSKRWENMEQFCREISDKKDIWYTGSGDLANYIIALKKVIINDNEIINPKENSPIWINLSSGTTILKPGKRLKIKSK